MNIPELSELVGGKPRPKEKSIPLVDLRFFSFLFDPLDMR
jgi:hypothetical protein